MKLNKFLAAAVAATVLPLSVAHAEGPAAQPEGVNGPAAVQPALPALDPTTGKPVEGVSQNGPGAVQPALPALDPTTGKPVEGVHQNGPGAVQPALPALDPSTGKPFVGVGQNGPGAVQPALPEYKLPAGKSSDNTFGPRKGQVPAKAQNGQKVLPKTSAVK